MPTNSWYLNPGWFAFAISCVSLAISLFVYLIHRETLTLNTRRGLVLQAAAINEAIARYKVRGPYAYHLKIPDERLESFTGKTVVLLNHINLLQDVHDNRKKLGSQKVMAYEKWATTIVRPWIESDADLRRVWGLLRESKDWMGKDFLRWLDKLFPLVPIPN